MYGRNQKKLAIDIYLNTKSFPKEELYGLTSQLRRSGVSVPVNIAEGYGRNSTNDYLRFLKIARGSLFELQTLLDISIELQFFKEEFGKELYERSQEVDRMLSSLIYKIENKQGT